MGEAIVIIVFVLIIGVVVAIKVDEARTKRGVVRSTDTPRDQAIKGFAATTRPLATFQGVHVYPDWIIKFGGETECHPIAGVSATTEEIGSISSRSTLTRSAVPGLHGWQKQTDNRQGYLVVDGPDFQWQISYTPGPQSGDPRGVAAAITTAGRQAALRAGWQQPHTA